MLGINFWFQFLISLSILNSNIKFQSPILIFNFHFRFRIFIFNFDLCSTIWVTRVAKNNTELNIGNDKPQAWPVLFTFGPITNLTGVVNVWFDRLFGSYPWCVVLPFKPIFLLRILHYIFLLFCTYWVCLRALLLASIKNSDLCSGRLCACIVTWQIKIWCLREILICLLELECT